MNVLTRKLRLAEITISGLKVETFVLSSHIVFETGLNEFRIDNPNDNTLYREIVSIEDGRAIQSLVKILKNATEDGCQRKHGESLRQSDSNLVRY